MITKRREVEPARRSAGRREWRECKLLRQMETETGCRTDLANTPRIRPPRYMFENGVFEDQIPADDPGEDLAQRRVRVRVRAAGDGNHRRQFGIAERREAARDRHQHERQRNGRPRAQAVRIWDAACSRSARSRAPVALRIGLDEKTLPAAAVPVTVKIPDPMTAPMPRAVRLHGPSDFRSRLPGSSEAAISASMLLVRRSWLIRMQARAGRYRFRWPLTIFCTFFFMRAARDPGGALGLRRRFLARCALQLLAFGSVFISCFVFILP